MNLDKPQQSLEDLQLTLDNYHSISAKSSSKRKLAFLSLSKAFEVAVEYTWKALKHMLRNEGLDPQSPKSVLREAAKAGYIDDLDSWLEFIDARNSGIHDYFSIPEKDYVKYAATFLDYAQSVIEKLQET